MDQGGVAEVVEGCIQQSYVRDCRQVNLDPAVQMLPGLTIILDEDRAGLEPDSLLELNAVLLQQLGGEAAKSTKHGPAGVDDLKLTVASKGLRIS